jgi:hypothetical protein
MALALEQVAEGNGSNGQDRHEGKLGRKATMGHGVGSVVRLSTLPSPS